MNESQNGLLQEPRGSIHYSATTSMAKFITVQQRRIAHRKKVSQQSCSFSYQSTFERRRDNVLPSALVGDQIAVAFPLSLITHLSFIYSNIS
jgi:hypothetical protein